MARKAARRRIRQPKKIVHKGRLKITVNKDGSVEIMASLSGELVKEEGMWISLCPPLDLTTCGKTRKEAMQNTEEAVRVFFESCIRHRTLEEALNELKWTREEEIHVDGLAAPRSLCRSVPVPPAFVIDKVKKDGTWRGHVNL